MGTQEILLLVIIALSFIAILLLRIRGDLVGLGVLLALAFTGILSPDEAIAGFSQPAIITLISMFILTEGLEETGVIAWIGERLRALAAGSSTRLSVLFMGTAALLAQVMNLVAAGTVLLPAATAAARDSNVKPSKLLIPVSFGTLLGGTATYFATANIVVNSLLASRNLPTIPLTGFLPTGIPIILAGLLYMALFGKRLLPERESAIQTVTPTSLSRSLYETYQLNERLWEVRVQPTSRLANVALSRSGIGEELGLSVLAIWRGHEAILTPNIDERLHAGDYLLVLGREDRVSKLNEWGLTLGRNGATPLRSGPLNVDFTEVIIPPRSSAIGKTLQELRFRDKFGLTSVALWRGGRSWRTDVGKFRLEEGDALLMVGAVARIDALAKERDYLVLQSSHAVRPRHPHKIGIILLIFAAVLLVSLLGIVPTTLAVLTGAVAVVASGTLTMDQAYRAVEWRVVFTVAGMLSLSTALTQTGLATRLGSVLVGVFAPGGELVFIAGLFLVTMLVTQIVSGQVSALIMGTIAISAALQLGLHPEAVAIATATACSTAFLTPSAHPVNVLMMTPGGYRPSDFLRVGLGLTVVVFFVLMVGMVVFWGIR